VAITAAALRADSSRTTAITTAVQQFARRQMSITETSFGPSWCNGEVTALHCVVTMKVGEFEHCGRI
jgi:hypothetical protein